MFRTQRLILFITLFVYLLAAINSLGYYNPDEHFQILEFANLKLGNISPSELPWEYRSGLRASFQPWIAFLLIKGLRYTGIFDPYLTTLLLRLISGGLAVYAIIVFCRKKSYQVFPKYRLFFWCLSAFLWFLPFINVRFSSESWSGIFILLAAAYIQEESSNGSLQLFLAGILCGIAFLCRFQSALMIAGLLLWLLFIKKEGMRKVSLFLSAIFIILILGLILDRVFYGKWVFAFVNYFKVNLIDGAASNFGTTDWYTYVLQVIFAVGFPLGLLLFTSLLIVLVDSPKYLIIWMIIPLLIMHLIIPHKELRFLFPLSNFVPLLLIKAWQQSLSLFPQTLSFKRTIKAMVLILALLNAVSLSVCVFIPPSNGRMSITKYLKDNYSNRPVKVFVNRYEEENPFQPYSFLRQSFYEMPNVRSVSIKGYQRLTIEMVSSDTISFLVIHKGELVDTILTKKIKELNLIEIKEGVPRLALAAEEIYDNRSNTDVYVLFKKQ